MRPRNLVFLSVLALLALPAAEAFAQAEVRLLTAPYARPGAYAPVRITGAGEGPHQLRGVGVMAVRWEGGAPVVLPLLIAGGIPGGVLRLELDGQPVEIEVAPLSRGERLILNAAASPAARPWLGGSLFPGVTVREVAIAPEDATPAVALELADALVLDAAPPGPIAEALLAAGVTLVVATAPGEGWQELAGAGAWVRRPSAAPRATPIEPEAYAATTSWRAGRPASERRILVVATMAYVLLGGGALWALRGDRARALAAGGLAAIAVLATLAWVALRPEVAVRWAQVLIVQPDRAAILDRWTYLALPAATEPQEIDVAFEGSARPVAWDAAHWEALAPVLVCDRDGAPQSIRLRISPGTQAAALHRQVAPAGEAAALEPWASPLVRRWYLPRLSGATETAPGRLELPR